MNDSTSSASLINESQIFGMKNRVRTIDEQIKTLGIEREKLIRIVEMAEALSSEAHLLTSATAIDSSDSKFLHVALSGLDSGDAFPKAVMAVVERAEDGASYVEIREALLQSPLAKRLQKSDKGFYHALRRLKISGELVDRGGFVFTPQNLRIFLKKVEAGLKDDRAIDRSRSTTMMDLIMEIVAKNPGVAAKDVIQDIRKQSAELDAKLSSNDGSAYNAIARFKKRGELEAFGHLNRQLRIGPNASEVYKRLARSGVVLTMPKRTEALSGRSASASVSREVAPSLFENQSGRKS